MFKRKVVVSVFIFIAILLQSYSNLYAAKVDTYLCPETLTGLHSLKLVVNFNPEVVDFCLRPEQLISDTVSRLRRSSIGVFTPEQSLRLKDVPILFVDVTVIPPSDPNDFYTYTVDLEIHQLVFLSRRPTITAPAVTWSTRELGVTKKPQDIRASLKLLVEQFIEDSSSLKTK